MRLWEVACLPDPDALLRFCTHTQGPVFDELDENLQKAFDAYLQERGITPALGGLKI